MRAISTTDKRIFKRRLEIHKYLKNHFKEEMNVYSCYVNYREHTEYYYVHSVFMKDIKWLETKGYVKTLTGHFGIRGVKTRITWVKGQ